MEFGKNQEVTNEGLTFQVNSLIYTKVIKALSVSLFTLKLLENEEVVSSYDKYLSNPECNMSGMFHPSVLQNFYQTCKVSMFYLV